MLRLGRVVSCVSDPLVAGRSIRRVLDAGGLSSAFTETLAMRYHWPIERIADDDPFDAVLALHSNVSAKKWRLLDAGGLLVLKAPRERWSREQLRGPGRRCGSARCAPAISEGCPAYWNALSVLVQRETESGRFLLASIKAILGGTLCTAPVVAAGGTGSG